MKKIIQLTACVSEGYEESLYCLTEDGKVYIRSCEREIVEGGTKERGHSFWKEIAEHEYRDIK